MLRSLLIIGLLPLAISSLAQTDVVKTPDSPTARTGEIPIIVPVDVTVIGDIDVAPAPPACNDTEGQDRSSCIHKEVLAAIRKGMDASADRSGPHSHPVMITFVINQFGEMKDIRVEHTGSTELPKKVIVALYALPKFSPARKDGKAVGSTVKITYPYESLFTAE